jgi:hypothetical protein
MKCTSHQMIQLGYRDMGTELLGPTKGCGELRALVECIAALAGLNLDKLPTMTSRTARRDRLSLG